MLMLEYQIGWTEKFNAKLKEVSSDELRPEFRSLPSEWPRP
jgi:hypothetical protein